MNVKELIEKYEYLNHNYFRRVDTSEILKDLKQLDKPKKNTIPQFVADFISEQKKQGYTLSYSIDASMSDRVAEWYWGNSELFARAWLDGYEVEKEKRYVVSLKNGQPLTKTKSGKAIYFNQDIIIGNYKFTRKELEEANFGWVFDCEGIEIEEVE
nr:MAG TPA: Protein of unknown function (DUF1642) [Caudoviricetes sp.]